MVKAASPDFRHRTPPDLLDLLKGSTALKARWDDLTPLARNEWICWMTSAKKAETRDKRKSRLVEEVLDGKRRPCCWPGCPHRRESARKWVAP